MKKFLLPLAALTLLAAGCGSAGAGSCTQTTGAVSFCVNYTGSSFTTASAQALCPASTGTYSSGACPTGGSGTCTFQKGTTSEFKWTFPSGLDGGSGFSAQTFCTSSGGEFSAN